MSSISSGVDITLKYQRLSAEFVKARNQVAVLKSALLEEQSRTGDLRRELNLRDTNLRKLESERDSLLFRNDQLVKRVESLQENMDAQHATFSLTKGKKKYKEANLRLVAESSRMHQQALGGTSSDPSSVIEEELERKISENGELHSRLFDVEKRFDEATTQYLHRIDQLEKEIISLKTEHSCSRQKVPIITTEIKGLEADYLNVNGSTDTKNINGGEFTYPASDEEPSRKTNEAQPSNLLNGAELTGPSRDSVDNAKLFEEYYADRIATLTKSLQHATGRATYYKNECEDLIRRNLCDQKTVETLQKQISELENNCESLKDALETTQSNYEAQFRELYECMDAKMTARIDHKMPTNDDDVSHSENGSAGSGKTNKNDRQRLWFSSSK